MAGNLWSLDLHRRDESVAPAWDSLDKPGIAGIVPKSFPDLQYRDPQALIEFDKGILWPKPSSNLVPRHNLSGALHKQYQ